MISPAWWDEGPAPNAPQLHAPPKLLPKSKNSQYNSSSFDQLSSHHPRRNKSQIHPKNVCVNTNRGARRVRKLPGSPLPCLDAHRDPHLYTVPDEIYRVTNLRPDDTEGGPFWYTFRVQCTSCRETHPNPISVSRFVSPTTSVDQLIPPVCMLTSGRKSTR